MAHPTTTKMVVIRRACSEQDAEVVKLRLSRARQAGLLESYDDDAIYDLMTGEVVVFLHAERMHPSERSNFACERTVAELAVERSIALHCDTLGPPKGAPP